MSVIKHPDTPGTLLARLERRIFRLEHPPAAAALGLPMFPTASAPPYVLGGVYFDTTLSKMRVGGVSGWETVTSV